MTTLDTFRPRPTHNRAVYTVQEVANLLGLALGSTYTLIREGSIPATKLGGRWVVSKRRFHNWLDNLNDDQDDGDLGVPVTGFDGRPVGRW